MGRRRHPSARPIQRQAPCEAESSFGSVSLHEAVSLSGSSDFHHAIAPFSFYLRERTPGEKKKMNH